MDFHVTPNPSVATCPGTRRHHPASSISHPFSRWIAPLQLIVPAELQRRMHIALRGRVDAAFSVAFAIAFASASASPAQIASGATPPTTGLLNPPLGPHTALGASNFVGVPTFQSRDRLVLTPYFYWYDGFSGEHLFNSDGSDALTDHPPTFTGFSYRSMAWHQTQLRDMIEAGIDIVLPVYWGEPSARRPGKPASQHPWSYAGIPPLVEARESLVAQGHVPPRIGLFYDTSTLQFNEANERIDLTTPRGRQWFYESIRDFFSLVPPRHWAMIDGKPVVFLYSAAFALKHDATCFEYLATAFAADFGGRTPFVVREISWNVVTDQVYAWGGALGLKNPGVASLGPGYDHSAVPGRTPLIVPRQAGSFYEENWLRFLRRPSPLVVVETWNEFHEGTDVAHSREYGRQYITDTRRFVDLFKAGYHPPRPPGPYGEARLVEVTLGSTNVAAGLTQIESADGITQPAVLDHQTCRVLAPNPHGPRYAYFRIDESFKWAESMTVLVVIELFDAARGTLKIEFDGSDPSAPFQGAYTASESIALNGTSSWRTVALRLMGARFQNAQNAGADFRIAVGEVPLGLRRVQILREGLKAMQFQPAEGFELQVYASPGLNYDLEGSVDLVEWTPLARLRPASSVSRHIAPTTPGRPHQWYRLRRPPS